MPKFQGNGARTNTVGGKNVVIQQMSHHYQALANMKPHIDTNEPNSRKRHKKLQKRLKSPKAKAIANKSVNSPLGYRRAPKPKDAMQKTMIAIKRISNSGCSFPNKRSADDNNLSDLMIQRRERKEQRLSREHQKRLDKINQTIWNLDHQSVHARKHNLFDPIAYPVTLFRRDTTNFKPTPCLSDSSKNLGSLKLVKDTKTKRHLSKSFSCSHRNNNVSATAPMTSRKRPRGATAPSSPMRPQSARICSSKYKRKKISKCNSARKVYSKKQLRPSSAMNTRISQIPFDDNNQQCTFDFDENDCANIGKSVNTDSLQLKNQIMSEIIQQKIFAQEKLIDFFKKKLLEFGSEEYVIRMIRELCDEFHLPFQNVMVDTK